MTLTCVTIGRIVWPNIVPEKIIKDQQVVQNLSQYFLLDIRRVFLSAEEKPYRFEDTRDLFHKSIIFCVHCSIILQTTIIPYPSMK